MALLPQRFAPEQCEAVAREVLAAHRGQPGALLPILHDIQDRLGAVPPELLPLIAEDLRKKYGERRFQALGLIAGRLHAMVFTPRADKIHVISLRKANRREMRRYEAQA